MNEQDNVAVVKAMYDAMDRGDVEGIINLHTPDCLWIDYSPDNSGLRGDWRGASGIETFMTNLEITLHIKSFVPQKMLADEDTVVSIVNFTFIPTGSDSPETARLVQIFKLADEKIEQLESFPSESEEIFTH